MKKPFHLTAFAWLCIILSGCMFIVNPPSQHIPAAPAVVIPAPPIKAPALSECLMVLPTAPVLPSAPLEQIAANLQPAPKYDDLTLILFDYIDVLRKDAKQLRDLYDKHQLKMSDCLRQNVQ